MAIVPPLPVRADNRRYEIALAKMKFGSEPKNLRVGDRIVWINHDIFRHTATARDLSFDIDLLPGAEAEVVLSRRGLVAVYCRFHPGMQLQLEIAS